MNELQSLQPLVMTIFGGGMQYLRAFAWFPEPVYHLLAVSLAAFGYVLFNPVDSSDWRVVTVKAIIGVSGLLTSTYGGTFLASSGAKALAANNKPAIIPVTNSK